MFKLSRWTKQLAFVGIAICAVLLATAVPSGGEAATATTLGTAQSFAVLAGSTVTNTGPTTINGSVGVNPGAAITGFPPGLVSGGVLHRADAVALQAQSDVTTAYNVLAGQECNVDLTGQDLGGMTLTPGVYCFSSSAQLTGALTLDAQGDAGAVFIFQIGSTLTTASNSSVQVINGGSACTVYWKIGSSATLGTTTAFSGNILALDSITLNTGVSVIGRALAQTAAVTMDSNNITIAGCMATAETPTTTPETTPITTPVTTPVTTPATTPVTTPATAPVVVTDTTPTSTPVTTQVTPPTGASGGTGQTPSMGDSGNVPSTGNAAVTPAAGDTTGTAATGDTGATSETGNGTTVETSAATQTTPSPTATAQSTSISFPNTGSLGPTSSDQSGISSGSLSMLVVALMLLLSGGIGFVAMKRYRH